LDGRTGVHGGRTEIYIQRAQVVLLGLLIYEFTAWWKLQAWSKRMSPIGPSRQAAFYGPTVANGALRTWLDLPLAGPGREW
jgi:hypothetical protein